MSHLYEMGVKILSIICRAKRGRPTGGTSAAGVEGVEGVKDTQRGGTGPQGSTLGDRFLFLFRLF